MTGRTVVIDGEAYRRLADQAVIDAAVEIIEASELRWFNLDA